jgi:ABC-type siderophore export system fused ATPase/permease subunit
MFFRILILFLMLSNLMAVHLKHTKSETDLTNDLQILNKKILNTVNGINAEVARLEKLGDENLATNLNQRIKKVMKLFVKLIQFANTTIDENCAIVRFLTTLEPVLQLLIQQIIDALNSLSGNIDATADITALREVADKIKDLLVAVGPLLDGLKLEAQGVINTVSALDYVTEVLNVNSLLNSSSGGLIDDILGKLLNCQ